MSIEFYIFALAIKDFFFFFKKIKSATMGSINTLTDDQLKAMVTATDEEM